MVNLGFAGNLLPCINFSEIPFLIYWKAYVFSSLEVLFLLMKSEEKRPTPTPKGEGAVEKSNKLSMLVSLLGASPF